MRVIRNWILLLLILSLIAVPAKQKERKRRVVFLLLQIWYKRQGNVDGKGETRRGRRSFHLIVGGKFLKQNTCFVPPCLRVRASTCECSPSKWLVGLTPDPWPFWRYSSEPAGQTQRARKRKTPHHCDLSWFSSAVLTVDNNKKMP